MYTARKRGVGTVICLEPKAREGVLRHVKGGKGARAQLGSEHHRSLHVFLSPLSPRSHGRPLLLSFLKTVSG